MTDRADHPWLGELFGDAEIAQMLSAEADLHRMLRIEAAWTRAIAPEDISERIASRTEHASINPGDLAAGTSRDGVPVPELVRILKKGIPEEQDHRWIHNGLTSQDVMDTALVMALQEVLPVLQTRLDGLNDELDALSARDGHRRLMGMTRMQPALPIQTGDRISTWQRPLVGLAADLTDLKHRCAILQWGGPVGVRDPNLPAKTGPTFAKALDLRDPRTSWHNDRGVLSDLSAKLSRITGATGKIGQDIALLAQTDPSALRLSSGGASSAMPHKQNPILAELLVTLARRNTADLALMHQALVHEQERSGAAWMLEWIALPQMLITTGRSLSVARTAIGSITRIGEVS